MYTCELFISGSDIPNALSKQEIYELLQKMKCGDEKAREILILHSIRLVLYQVFNRFKTVNYDKRELVSIGNLGLMKAIETFDISKNIEFSTYATKCINNEILMFLRKLKKYQNMDSLDKIIWYGNDGHDLKLEDIIYDENDMTEKYIHDEEYRIIRQTVNDLPERDKKIIMMYFGFYDDKIYSQKEIADEMSISRAYVSSLISKNVDRIRKKLQRNGIIELRKKADYQKQKIGNNKSDRFVK